MLIKRLTLKKILSFNDCDVELGPLNVLIGPNAVGKSNLIEVIGLLQAAPTDIATTIRVGGGIRQWLWLGEKNPSASIRCELTLPGGGPLIYGIEFAEEQARIAIQKEYLGTGDGAEAPNYFHRSGSQVRIGSEVTVMPIPDTESLFSELRSPADTTPITRVGRYFGQMRIYREFRTSTGSQARIGIPTVASKDSLTASGDNLALVLHELDFLGVHEQIRKYLRRFCERFEDLKISVGEGIARAFLTEAGLSERLSAIRMSDGTLKFLCLLAALFHPEPPPLMCIEEPELGLHPDALRLVVEALVEASQSMQLIVTTHSEALVDALSDQPEAVLVCERDFDNGTQFKRLQKERLKEWLEHYSLGQLWRNGEIGGGRW